MVFLHIILTNTTQGPTMQAKRSHLDSFGESDSNNGGALKKTVIMATELEREQTPRPMGILTVSSPEVMEESVQSHVNLNGKLASFLEKCHFCKKMMFNADAFMYGYLRAFCSPDCRSKHIAIEKLVKGIVRVKTEGASANQNSSNDNKKNGSGSAQPNPSDSA